MRNDWTDDELAAAVAAYREMARDDAAGKPYSKKAVYRELASRFGRSDKSFEYRMQNISAVLDEMGQPWIDGLKPAPNVGVNVKGRIRELLGGQAATPGRNRTDDAPYKTKLPAMRDWLIEVARSRQKVTYADVMMVFDIDRFSLRHAMDHLGHQAEDLGEPIITALIVSKETGRCSEGLANEFGVQDDEAERQRLYEFWPITSTGSDAVEASEAADVAVRAARFASVEARPEQAAFRRRVFLAWDGRCVISGCDVGKALDAAHRHGRDWRLGHNHGADGYLLRKDLHALYDCKLLTISDDGTVQLDPSIANHYQQFRGICVRSNVCQGSCDV